MQKTTNNMTTVSSNGTLLERIYLSLEIASVRCRSAWSKGVNEYALELIETLINEERQFNQSFTTKEEIQKALLNGADSWSQYSHGGSSLIYDGDICERLCTPSEIKKKRNGELQPNSKETWLDVQARALYQANNRIIKHYHAVIKNQ